MAVRKTRVYVAAPFARFKDALDAHYKIKGADFETLGSWANVAAKERGVEETGRVLQERIATNDRESQSADIMLMLSYADGGGQMFSECGIHLYMGKPVVWIDGRRTLDSHRPLVTVVATVEEAVVALKALRSTMRTYGDVE